MQRVAINTRALRAHMTGVQRYTTELLARWNGKPDRIATKKRVHGLGGHAWEQFVLPVQLKGRLLFSPSNTGPLRATNQVVTIHDTSVFDCPEAFSPSFAVWYRFLLPRLAQRSRLVIPDSEFIKQHTLCHTTVSHEKANAISGGWDARFWPVALGVLGESREGLSSLV